MARPPRDYPEPYKRPLHVSSRPPMTDERIQEYRKKLKDKAYIDEAINTLIDDFVIDYFKEKP